MAAPMQEPDSAHILERLKELHPETIDLSLDRMTRLLAALGHPERAVPPVAHVAGTNGKGSVIAFLRACLEAAGLPVHAYTSPHLVRFHERIRVCGGLIGERSLADALRHCERVNAGLEITYFEAATAAAFVAFARRRAEALLLEVGLGGRLDATNVIPHPAVCVITPVSLDHQHFLGESLEEIAAEKAGILKSGVPVVVGPQPPAALEVIAAAAAQVGAPMRVHGRDWMAWEEHGRLVFQDSASLLDLPLPRLRGRHQIDNAGAAVAALRTAKAWDVPMQALEKGLSAASWPGRLQRMDGALAALAGGGDVWLDGGHNPAAGRVLAAAMAELTDRLARPLYLVAGMMKTKNAQGFFAPFKGLARGVETVPLESAAAFTPQELAAHAQAAGVPGRCAGSAAEAVRRIADGAGAEPRILICGSLYLAGQVLAQNGAEDPGGLPRASLHSC